MVILLNTLDRIFTRDIMKKQERNQFVAAALFRKAGAHKKSNKAKRKLEKQELKNTI